MIAHFDGLKTIAEYSAFIGMRSSTWVRDKVTARAIHFSLVGRHVRFSSEDHDRNLAIWHQAPIQTPTAPVVSFPARRRRSA